jgi:hypothetical protein
MPSFAADKVLVLLERVLEDALAHEVSRILVTATSSGFRFETEIGASLGFLPRIQVVWQDVQGIFERLQADAQQHGFSDCVTVDAAGERVTVTLKGNESYFSGRVKAIMEQLRT